MGEGNGVFECSRAHFCIEKANMIEKKGLIKGAWHKNERTPRMIQK